MNEPKTKVFTFGTSRRDPAEFIDILKQFDIRQVADVRRFPTSQLEHFKKKNLAALCESNGIQYCWLGELLGGFRTGGYETYMKSAAFGEGLNRLKRLAANANTAFCCAERMPSGCHRRFIAQQLEKEDWEVIHILDKNEIWRPQQLELFE